MGMYYRDVTGGGTIWLECGATGKILPTADISIVILKGKIQTLKVEKV